MNQEELKQRLIELVEQPMPMMCGTVTYGEMRMPEYQARFIVNNLIANGVTIRERGEWGKISHISDASCSKCRRSPKMLFGMLPDFCPHCGADMRGGKDE